MLKAHWPHNVDVFSHVKNCSSTCRPQQHAPKRTPPQGSNSCTLQWHPAVAPAPRLQIHTTTQIWQLHPACGISTQAPELTGTSFRYLK